jgi:hypothetical protein
LTDDEYEIVKEQAQSADAMKAVVMTASATDGAKAAPLKLEDKRPAVVEEEDEAPAPAPAPAPKAKAKAKPAPAVVEDDDEAEDTAPEPEVRKAAPKATAVPAGKSSLANIVADWDDE